MRILCTGGAGYVGSVLVPALLQQGHFVTVVDWFLYGETLQRHRNLIRLKQDLRTLPAHELRNHDAVIHLACISNDPSFELDPDLGRSVNYDATERLVKMAEGEGVTRFIYASSSSVYGVKPDGVEVTEDLSLEPLTDYSKYKAMGEEVVLKQQRPWFHPTVVRPATLCGYSPRQRLDLIVNILTKDAFFTQQIGVHGGTQRRPNLHVQDMVDAYVEILNAAQHKVAGQVFNVGGPNHTVLELAQQVAEIVGGHIVIMPETNDPRSYAINSRRILQTLGFRPVATVGDAIRDLTAALASGKCPNALTDPKYYNIKQMQLCHIS